MLASDLEDGERGVIICTAAVAFEGQIGPAACAASKGGVLRMTICAARDFADAVRVVTIAPRTPMLAGASEEVRASLAAEIRPPRRPIGPPNSPNSPSRS